MKRVTKWRPWQFGLRSLLLLTTVIAACAAFAGWRARQLEPQRRAVARIVELGGAVEMERRGWLEAIKNYGEFQKVVAVTIPGHLADEAIPHLNALPGLRRVTMAYSRQTVGAAGGLASQTFFYEFLVAGELVSPEDERPRFTRLKEQLPEVEVDVSHDGTLVPIDAAFEGSETFHNVFG